MRTDMVSFGGGQRAGQNEHAQGKASLCVG